MTEKPDFINLKFTSFKKQEEYKPPASHNLFFQQPKKDKKTKYVPSGEWADDNDLEEELKTNDKLKFENVIGTQDVKQEKGNTKFAFIKKNAKNDKK